MQVVPKGPLRATGAHDKAGGKTGNHAVQVGASGRGSLVGSLAHLISLFCRILRAPCVQPPCPSGADRFRIGKQQTRTHCPAAVRGAPIKPVKIGVPADVAIGISNGLLGGLTGLGGVISTISCQLRGWSKDKQRAVFQPVLFTAFVIISVSQLIAASYTVETVKLYGIGLPFMIAGIWIEFKLYGTINDETFRKSVLILVLLAGVSLVASASRFMLSR
ncbi:hypothetical protein [Bradyrhizobium hereditatis]|uniref:hypothetical protein n=1 Tax=Bradyrhizobium hereditatis TaxID=2821405 RepID=UPI001CE33FD8|nr:hypothetical protein [Bradyrhizobium hereditatis]